jgi:hypothetical protein
MATRGDLATRYTSRYRDDELPDVVAAVARVAAPDDPLGVSTRRWDAHRAAAGHPDAPSARQITTRLNRAGRNVLSWPRIVRLAFATRDEQRQSLVSAARRPEQPHLGVAHVDAALRLAARFVSGETVYPDEYEVACERALAELPAGPRREGLAAQLPTVGQIERIARNHRAEHKTASTLSDWDYALTLAGLPPRPAVQDPARGKRKAMEVVEMLDLFARLAGLVPTYEQARTFAIKHKLALRDVPYGDWGAIVERYKRELADAGRPVPEGPFAHRRLRVEVPDGALDGLPRRHGRGQYEKNPDLALDKLQEYLDSLPAGQRPTLRHYRAVKKEKARVDWPAPNVFTTYHGGLTAAIEKVRARARR